MLQIPGRLFLRVNTAAAGRNPAAGKNNLKDTDEVSQFIARGGLAPPNLGGCHVRKSKRSFGRTAARGAENRGSRTDDRVRHFNVHVRNCRGDSVGNVSYARSYRL